MSRISASHSAQPHAPSSDAHPSADQSSLRTWQNRTGTAFLLVLVAAFPVVLVRLIQINTVERDHLLALTRKERASHAVIPARRGDILDRKGRILATTRHTADVFIDPKAAEKKLEEAVGAVAARLNKDESEIWAAIDQRPGSRYVILARQVDDITAEAIDALPYRGVGLTRRSQRYYPHDEQLSQLLGFVGTEGHGMEGVELAYDEHLSGTDGKLSSVRDAHRNALYLHDEGRRDPIDGSDVTLTIDLEIQRMTEAAVAEQVESFAAESGVGIVMDPKTGEVLAMACVPSFNLNDPFTVDKSVWRNRILTDPVEPGSTFKPFIAGGALMNGVVTTTEEIDCEDGTMRLNGRTIRDTHPNGIQTIAGIITQSSNIGMVKVGRRMSDEVLYQTLRLFGFGRRTGIGLPGESSGLVYSLKNWSPQSGVSISFGYEVMITPLQLITGFCAILNDGIWTRPSIVLGCRNAKGAPIACELQRRLRKVRESVPEQSRSIDAASARFVAFDAMRSVVVNGKVKRHFKGPYTVLGKTGTAKLMKDDRTGYAARSYLGTFMGAAPTSDPRLAVVVMIRRPDASKGYYGGTTAAPAVSRILTEALTYFGVPPDNEEHVTFGQAAARRN